METISSLLNKALGEKNAAKGNDMDVLPKSLQDLARAISASAKSTEKEASASEKRQKIADSLQRRFITNLEELANVTATLNATQRTTIQRSEERAKRAELAQKRAEARNSRAEKENSVRGRQNSERQANWLNLIGAVGGKSLQNLVGDFVKAREQTDKDVSTIAAARYEEKIASIDAARDDAIAEADARLKDEATAIAQAYQKGLSKSVSAEGAEAAAVANAAAKLTEFEKKEEAYKKAQAERDRINEEGLARIHELEAGAASGQKPQGASVVGSLPHAIGAPVAPGQGVILDASGRPVPSVAQMAAIEKAKKEHSEAYNAAEAAVSEKEISPDARSAARVAYATMARGELSAEYEKPDRLAEAARSALAMANERAESDKAKAIDTATNAKIVAANERDAGSLVSKAEKKSIGLTNMLSGAIAPPAIQFIAKSLDEFTKLFPVVKQAGGAIVELTAAVPAGLLLLSTAISGALLQMGNEIKESLTFGKSNVSKRYDKSNEAWIAHSNKSRGQMYSEAQTAQVEMYKERNDATLPGSASLPVGTISAPKANAPREFTREITPSASGPLGYANTAAEAREEMRRQERAAAAARAMEGYHPNQGQSIGVVPVAPSNRNIDEWR